MRALSCVAAVCVFSVGLIAADNPFAGTWKLNPAKSKGTPGTLSKEETVTFEAVGDQMKRSVTGIDPDGKALNSTSTIPWDGKDHQITGPNGPPVTVAVTRVNDRTVDVKVKSAEGKVLTTGRAAVSRDGKTLTTSFKGEDPKGRKFNNIEVFDKQ